MTGTYSTLARRYLLGKKGRTLMTFLGIALGVTMVVAVLLINGAILASYENLLSAAAGRADLQISATTGFGFKQDLLATADKVAGVEVAAPVVSSSSPVVAGEQKGVATFYGIDPERDRRVRDYKLTSGVLPTGDGEVAVSSELATGLGLTAGAKVNLLTTKGLKEFKVAGIFDAEGTVRGALGPFAVMTIPAAQAAFGKEGRLDLIDVIAPQAEAVKERLTQALGGGQVRVG
ncbi:MAG TPA: ABC transporter permease, partial [Symbiobacteriaceae bacterium]|nr:ABC transporter permease [Symbiobacteriaceae bacterium]